MKIKKVLMLTHPEMDHLAYMMYDGLYKVLGKDNVYIYPYVRHYQGGIDDWYTLDDGKRGHTAPPGYASTHETPEKSFDELVNDIDSFDITYLSSARTYAVRSLDQFIERVGRHKMPPIVFSEGEDYQSLHTVINIKRKYNPVVSFKREYVQSEVNKNPEIHPIYPLPFSAITDNLPPDNPNKDIDVFALFGNTWPIREKIVKKIMSSHLPDKYNIHVGIDHFSNEPEKAVWQDPNRFNIPPLMQYGEYMKMMARSKINIVARGWGCDTLRRFEAMCFSGLVMSDNLIITTPEPFIDNEHIIYYSEDLNGLVERIEYYLNSPGERERIGKGGKDHCMKHHTTEARARQFLSRIEEHI